MELILGLILGSVAAYAAFQWRERQLHREAQFQSKQLVESAQRESDAIIREARLTANEETAKIRNEAERRIEMRRREISESELKLEQRESFVKRQLEDLDVKERFLQEQEHRIHEKNSQLENEKVHLQKLVQQRSEELSRIAHFTEAEAKAAILKEAEKNAQQDAADMSRRIVEETKSNAEEEARRILSLAIQRYAGEHTFETTTATVNLPTEDIKGRIIGREGRNIRTFEAATGVTVLIDDTPNAVVLSAFDPVRREIAREAMSRLILDGRIHPTRIEEVVGRVKEEIDEAIFKAGEEAVFKTGLPPMHPELVKLLGRLKFRQSFTQNILNHSIEVAHLVGLMSAELGLDVHAGKRAGLLHDIGKAVNHEIEGAHAIVGAEILKRYGESDEVVNGVASHHDEVPHTWPYGILVSAADAISASRPGARSETMTTYIQRLQDLEKIGESFEGVEKCYAVQAGRELRVMVQPEQVDDNGAYLLARKIVKKIQEDLQYPGQIRVTVIRETRVIEFAK